MKSYVRSFNYTKANGERSQREVFVMRETPDAFDGFDFSHLTPDEAKTIQKFFKDHEIKPNFTASEHLDSDGFDKNWMRAWRRFNKNRM